MKRKVLYDSQVFDIQRIGGISKQVVYLAKNLQKYDYEITSERTDNVFLKSIKQDVNSHTDNMLYSLYKVSPQDYDILHTTYFYTQFLKYIGDKPFVLTIHDMIVEKFIGTENLKDDALIQVTGKQVLAQKCNKIITVSENSKKVIIEILGVPADKVVVCHNGADRNFAEGEDEGLVAQLNFEYILYVGTRGSTKNFDMLYKEFRDNIHPKYPDLKLFLVGLGYQMKNVIYIKTTGLSEVPQKNRAYVYVLIFRKNLLRHYISM